MRRLVTYLLLLTVGMLTGGEAFAQHISVAVPSNVAAGENFRIEYTVNSQDVDEFRMGSVPAGLEVLAGPYTSSQSSFQMINGHTSGSSKVTFTYVLYAAKNGTFTIGSAHAVVDGKKLVSQAVKIHVSGSVAKSGGAPKMHQDEDKETVPTASPSISGNQLFIKVTANKKRVHEQEPILLTYKVYTTVDLTQLEGKMPDLTGFHTQEVPLPQQKSFHLERVNGKPYKCVTWSQYVMYPQMTGKLEIPSITFKGIVVQQNRSVDPFEAFFNGGSGYVEVRKNIVAPGVTIQVDPLPKKPANFSGGVGRFNISAQLSSKDVKAGEPVTLRVVVGGIGNLKLLKQPVVNFPKDFDKYDAKVTDKTKLTSRGVEGNMIYDFLAVPRNQGKYEIPSVEFTYYDTDANAYKTIRTQSFTVNVAKGSGKTSVADYESEKDKDIHPIKKRSDEIHETGDFFFGSAGYIAILGILLCAFIVLLIVFRQRAIDNANIVKVKLKRANKVATKRLRKASRLMLAGHNSEFYDEVLRALWGYVGDKLNMPVEQLSRENIEEKLSSRGVDNETVSKFMSALDECEYERYAPGDVSGNMNRTFESAMTAIMEIEEVMKKNRKGKKQSAAAQAMLLLLMLIIPCGASAITKQNADMEYQKGNYQQAIQDYQEILQKGVSADIYYNLGNAYYRTDNIAQSILAYERALRLSPGDEDIRFNLQFVRSKTIDKITPESEMFFVTVYKSMVNFTSVDHWAVTAIVSLAVALLLLLLYLFGSKLVLRKIGFFGAAILLVVFLLSNLFAWQQKKSFEDNSGAIVTAPTVSVKKIPADNSDDSFVIHEGTKVYIIDRSMKNWRQIRLDDGREGWMRVGTIEEI